MYNMCTILILREDSEDNTMDIIRELEYKVECAKVRLSELNSDIEEAIAATELEYIDNFLV